MLLIALVTVKIGVFGLFHPTALHIEAPPSQVLLVNGAARQRADFVAGKQLYSVTARDGGPTSFTLSVPGKIERQFHGTLKIATDSGELIAVITMPREDAVASVVAAEYPDGTPLEAMKAAAVLARSYYSVPLKRHLWFDFCDTTHCQFHRAPPPPAHAAWQATKATEGLVMSYQDKPFAALYSASCGGRTRTAAANGLSRVPYPYFAVDCSACLRDAKVWTHKVVGDVVHTEQFRLARKIPSNNYFAEAGKVNGFTILHGRGEGHGLGLCQLGGSAMAAAGSSFRDILNYYYPNTACSRL